MSGKKNGELTGHLDRNDLDAQITELEKLLAMLRKLRTALVRKIESQTDHPTPHYRHD